MTNVVHPVFIDIAPLFEVNWTGIPVVTSQLVEISLQDKLREWNYLYNNQVIHERFVWQLMRDRSGRWLEDHLVDIVSSMPLPTVQQLTNSIAIFPNVKPLRGLFKHEAIIIHDLSTVLTPEYHNEDTIRHHANRLRRDIESSDTVICVSDATAEDVCAYFPTVRDRVLTAKLGVYWPLPVRQEASTLVSSIDIEPYIVVLGTVEPRKNIGIVLKYLAENIDLLEKFAFVFIGRDGWLNEKESLLSMIRERGINTDKLIFTGFISEALKLALLCRAEFSIFPSMFEGFGLPVVESLSLGVPVLCSQSSSLLEVSDDTCIRFDPLSLESFGVAFEQMIDRVAATYKRRRSEPLDFDVKARLQWSGFHKSLTDWLESVDEDA